MSAYVSLEGITKRYGNVKAVDNVNLGIDEHEFVTLLGPSGSGKTTMLMMLAGFVKPDKGKILVDGKNITATPPYRRNIGMVFQNYALFPHMTVYVNIAYPLKMKRISRQKIPQMVDEVLETVKLKGLEYRYPAQLSGGQQQRVALARAMVFRPPILLMDEPLGALDKKLREHMQLELKHIQEKVGITILYVTHDQEEALSMSTKIAVINEGQIEHMGTATDIYDHPANQFVADFIGETNIFRAKIHSVDDDGLQVVGPCIRRIRANTLKQVEVGQTVHLAVRPEKIKFFEKESQDHCFYDGIVDDIIYLGDVTKYYVRLSEVSQDEQEGLVVIKVQNRLGSLQHKRGERVKIGWNELDATII